MLSLSRMTHPVLLPVLCVVLLGPDLPAPGRPLAVGEARGLIGGELISRKEEGEMKGGSRHERKKRRFSYGFGQKLVENILF